MFQSLDLFVLSCFFLTVESQQGQILPPQNLSLLWINGFQPQLSWIPQHTFENCKYDGFFKTMEEGSGETYSGISNPWELYILMEGGFLHLSVKTVCNGRRSKPAVINETYPELVRNLECFVHSAKQTRCSWLAATPDLRFFYQLFKEDGTVFVNEKFPPNIQECPSYRYTGVARTGCDLEAGIEHSIDMLFNVTLNNTVARNTFKKHLRKDVRPRLDWTVTKTGHEFLIRCTPPDIPTNWTFTIKYTKCQEKQIIELKQGQTSTELKLVSHCPHCIAIKASFIGGETPWSEEKCFGADTDPNAFLYPGIIIPLMFACAALLICVCCRKNKEKLFPKVPEPRDLLSDIADNNNKITVRNLYIPPEEEKNCKITLVLDPQTNRGLLTT